MPAHEGLIEMLPKAIQPTCVNSYVLAATYGAVSNFTGLDLALLRVGAPPVVHHALAGGLADYQCRESLILDSNLAMSMTSGVVGAMLMRMIRGA